MRIEQEQLICEFPGCNQIIQPGERVAIKAIGDEPKQEKVVYHVRHFPDGQVPRFPKAGQP